MFFPSYRARRMRADDTMRRMVRETIITPDDFIYPLFVCHGKGVKKEISSMPGNYQQSVDNIVKDCKEVKSLGIPAVILFGIPALKDARGSEAYAADGIVQKAVKAIKDKVPGLMVITDVCLCEYTDHGHCGLLHGDKILNDQTVELLCKEALSHAAAGADMVAPSDMMDGRVAAIRDTLDESGYGDTPIMSYAVKYASAFYGPFREAAESTPAFGDRRSHQMDPANAREALREAQLDIDEGADIIMVKPALPYLDIIYRLREGTDMPIAAYNVSGEYSMIKAAGRMDWMDAQRAMLESLVSIKRAGADIILTYFAKEAAKVLNG